MTNESQKETADLVITRVFDASRARVFACWTDPANVPEWWGPRGYETLACAFDARPGGRWRVSSRHEDGSQTAESGFVREIDAPSRIVLTHAWEEADGTPGPETVITISFADEEGRTRMNFRQAGLQTAASRDGHETGWSESFDMLAEHLSRVPAVPASHIKVGEEGR
jgi:uncharacterized protein YndB with AHSA1/START domain